jgi:hypothetical protein
LANEDPNPCGDGDFAWSLAALASINVTLGLGLAGLDAAAPYMPPGCLAPPNNAPMRLIAETAFLTFFQFFFAGVHLARPCDATEQGEEGAR